MSTCDWLSKTSDGDGYSLDRIQKAHTVISIGSDAWVILREETGTLYFAVARFISSDSDGLDVSVEVFWHGWGCGSLNGSGLRECRHSYFGDDGYVFYIDGRIMSQAFKVLSTYFDEMV